MRYTVLTTGGVQTFLHSIARGIGCFWAMLVVTNKQRTHRKQNTMKKTIIALLALGGIAMGETVPQANLPTGTAVSDLTTGYAITDGTFSFALTLDVSELKKYLNTGGTAEKRLILSHQWTADTSYDQTVEGVTSRVEASTEFCIGVTTNFSSSGGKITTDSGLYTRLLQRQTPLKPNTSNADSHNRREVTSDSAMLSSVYNSNLSQFDWDSVSAAYMTYTYDNTQGGTYKGLSITFNLVDDEGISLYASYDRDADLRYSSYNTYNAYFDQDLVTAATYYSATLTKEQALTAAHVTKLLPEPTTATLSLLALAGLAVRRRRK